MPNELTGEKGKAVKLAAGDHKLSIFRRIQNHTNFVPYNETIIGSLRKPRQQRQWEPHRTKNLMSSIMAVHVRYNPWCINFAAL